MMLDLEIIPERSLGSDTWEFVLGMHFSQAVAIIKSQVGTIKGVQVIYSDQNPLTVDLEINMPQDGIRLIFDPVAQRLKIIVIYNMKLVKLRYSGVYFNSLDVAPSIEQVENCFGATHPALYDSQRHLFALNFRGLSFYFHVDSKYEPGYAHGLGSLQFPDGSSPVVTRTTIYYGSQHPPINPVDGYMSGTAPLPELPLSCYRQRLYLRRCDVLRAAAATRALRLHMYTESASRTLEPRQASLSRVVSFGASCQAISHALGAPARVYYKSDDKMRIHRSNARRRPHNDAPSDFYFNYFTLGLDVLFDANTHRAKKFVLHTNYPGHYNFNVYHRCEFEIKLDSDTYEANSLVDGRGQFTITPYSEWGSVARALRVSERPVVLNRATTTNSTNPFGSTFCYVYQDLIFEVMPNNHIASVTLYQEEEPLPGYAVYSTA